MAKSGLAKPNRSKPKYWIASCIQKIGAFSGLRFSCFSIIGTSHFLERYIFPSQTRHLLDTFLTLLIEVLKQLADGFAVN